MTTTHRRGVLVAVANPEGVAPLMAIALAASDPDDEPPPRVLALIRQRDAAAGTEVPGAQAQTPPPPPALTAAIEYARARGVTIDAQATHSNDPALDIITTARAAEVGWILLGYHRAASGGDTLGGVVREVFVKAKELPINVGAFIQGTDRPFERVFAAIDTGPDGRAALELGARIARNNRSRLRALLISHDAAGDQRHPARRRPGRYDPRRAGAPGTPFSHRRAHPAQPPATIPPESRAAADRGKEIRRRDRIAAGRSSGWRPLRDRRPGRSLNFRA